MAGKEARRSLGIFTAGMDDFLPGTLKMIVEDPDFLDLQTDFVNQGESVATAFANPAAQGFIMRFNDNEKFPLENSALIREVVNAQIILNGRPVIFITANGGRQYINLEEKLRIALPAHQDQYKGQLSILEEPFDIDVFTNLVAEAIAGTEVRRKASPETLAELKGVTAKDRPGGQTRRRTAGPSAKVTSRKTGRT